MHNSPIELEPRKQVLHLGRRFTMGSISPGYGNVNRWGKAESALGRRDRSGGEQTAAKKTASPLSGTARARCDRTTAWLRSPTLPSGEYRMGWANHRHVESQKGMRYLTFALSASTSMPAIIL